MRKNSWKLKFYGRIMAVVVLMSFLISPVFAEQPMEQQPNSTDELTRYYSDLEIDLLIEEIREAAHEAIEQAAGEAARAAFLTSLEREAAAIREAQRWRQEAELRQLALVELKKAGRKNTFLAVAIGIFGGLALGISGTLAIRN